MPDFSQHQIIINSVRLNYYRTGSGPAVILVHGLTDHALYWSALARALAADYDMVMYDSRGHGASDPSPTDYRLETLAGDLATLVGSLGLVRPAVIGHSMGASTASIAAATHPGLFRAIVLEDPVWRSVTPEGTPDMATVQMGWRADLLTMKAMDRAALLARVRGESPGWSDEDYEQWVDSKRAVNPDALSVLPSFARIWPDDVRAIDCPLLLLTGEPERGAIVDPGAAEIVRQLQPEARIVRINGVGHQVRREGFATYLREVREFLRQVP